MYTAPPCKELDVYHPPLQGIRYILPHALDTHLYTPRVGKYVPPRSHLSVFGAVFCFTQGETHVRLCWPVRVSRTVDQRNLRRSLGGPMCDFVGLCKLYERSIGTFVDEVLAAPSANLSACGTASSGRSVRLVTKLCWAHHVQVGEHNQCIPRHIHLSWFVVS